MTDAKIWGYWATLGWTVLAFFAGQFVGFGAIVWLRAGAWNSIIETPYDGILVTLFIVISNPVTIGVLALAARLKKTNPAEYFALHWPQRYYVTTGIVGLVALIAIFDASLFFSGHAVVTSFQLQS